MEQFAIFLHLGFIQVIRSLGPMEQLTIFLLGFPLGLVQVIRSPGPMELLAIFLLGFPLGLYNSKKVKNRKRPTCMKSATGSLFRQIFPNI